MCGVVGFILQKKSIDGAQSVLDKMVRTLHHRGPDDSGSWFDAVLGVGLGHTRLSIVDLTSEGHQPMFSSSKRFVISYNGEIYNCKELKKILTLKNRQFRGHCDTEILLEAIEEWGLFDALQKIVGMFAFALYDKEDQKVFLVRDRIGKKPLYYGEKNGALIFASELKAFKAFPGKNPEIDMNSLALYFRHNYIPSPYTIFKGIKKVEPSEIIEISLQSRHTFSKKYWSVEEIFKNKDNRVTDTVEELTDELEKKLLTAVKDRMGADVPVGAFLSGGIDSSLIVSIMKKVAFGPVKTFTIGFDEKKYNEAENANAVAKYLDTEHTVLYVNSNDALKVIPKITQIYDEPFADPSQIPTYLISELTKSHVTVSLTGDGGDELFYGYTRYKLTEEIWNILKKIPFFARKGMASLIELTPNMVIRQLLKLFHSEYGSEITTGRLLKIAKLLTQNNFTNFYRSIVSVWDDPSGLVLHSQCDPKTVFSANVNKYELNNRDLLMYLDLKTYLPDDILVKIDRASMAVALETRSPFLDHRVIEYACLINSEYKINNGKNKWILRELLKRYIPSSLFERPKKGFGIPLDEWLKGPLKDWGSDLLNIEKIKKQGYLNPFIIEKIWREHLQDKRKWHNQLWGILIFQSWLETKTTF